MSAEPAVYLDSSALVKLVVAEAESPALTSHLQSRRTRVSCGLARVEILRAFAPQGSQARARARELLGRISLIALDDRLLDDAAALPGPTLRSLDAIHLAAARALGDDLTELITYDQRMAAAASDLGMRVTAPS